MKLRRLVKFLLSQAKDLEQLDFWNKIKRFAGTFRKKFFDKYGDIFSKIFKSIQIDGIRKI